MYVPPYVPQPIEIPHNVAEERYPVRLGFVKRVVFLHFASVLLIVGIALSPLASPGLGAAVIWTFACLLALSIIRALTKGRDWEQRISMMLAPALFVCLGWLLREVSGPWPVWVFLFGPAAVLIYTLLCGRDLSYLGMLILSVLASTIAFSYAAIELQVPSLPVAETLILNTIYLFYFVYDLASLLTRRRLREEWGAMVDLYRDVLNMFTYPIRVWKHWRAHRIWSPR